jgi:integrase
MSTELPRGIRRRGDSLVVAFALADGTIERRALGPVSVSYAKEQRAIFQRQVREGTYQKKKPRPKEAAHTIADLWEMYLKSYVLAGKKAAWRQEAAWAHLKPQFGSLPPSALTTVRLIGYQTERLAAGASAGTVNRELSALSACLFSAAKMTVENGKPLLERVVIFPSKLKESAPRQGFITDVEYSVLAANAKPLWLRALIACAYSFGFRRSELLNLRVSQVDFFGKWIELREGETKNGEARKARMTAEVFELLKACTAGKNDGDYVFTRETGERVCDPRDDWYELCVASGLGQWVPAKRKNGKEFLAYRGLNLHDFRRSAIRNMTRRGVSETVAMKISGHKTASVFRRYNITDERDLAEATRKIELGRQVSTATETGSIGTDTKTDTPAISDAYAHS